MVRGRHTPSTTKGSGIPLVSAAILGCIWHQTIGTGLKFQSKVKASVCWKFSLAVCNNLGPEHAELLQKAVTLPHDKQKYSQNFTWEVKCSPLLHISHLPSFYFTKADGRPAKPAGWRILIRNQMANGKEHFLHFQDKDDEKDSPLAFPGCLDFAPALSINFAISTSVAWVSHRNSSFLPKVN